MAIKKAIFVVAGYGTRFLPATKAQPKEMLPIVDKPIIQYLVEEAVQAGIQEIIFVTGRGKNSIENHFDRSFELEQNLLEKNKVDKLAEIEKVSSLANFAYVRQPIQRGDGDALLCAKPFIDPTEPVLVIFPDYLMPKENKAIQKIIEIYREKREPVICGDVVPKSEVSKYGVMGFEETDNKEVVKITHFVEKPNQEDAPSNLINAGYFIITPEVIQILENAEATSEDGEIRLADAFVKMTEAGKDIYALKPAKPGYDCGSIIGFLKATITFGLEKEELREELLNFIKTQVKNNPPTKGTLAKK